MGLSPDAEAGPAPIPSDMHSVTPHLVCRDATSALDFYQRAFGASGAVRLDGPDGKLMHGCLWIGNSAVMLMEESPVCQSGSPVTLGGTPVTLHLYVPDADAAFERAVRAGATSVMAPADMFWGDRYGVVQDPYGHRWSIATHVRDVSPEDMRAAMAQFASA
ncbi:VOC family protein [Castellaniella daejeonensis]